MQLSSLPLSTRRRRAEEEAAAPPWPGSARPPETGPAPHLTAGPPQQSGSETRRQREGGARWKCLPPTAGHHASAPGWVPANRLETQYTQRKYFWFLDLHRNWLVFAVLINLSNVWQLWKSWFWLMRQRRFFPSLQTVSLWTCPAWHAVYLRNVFSGFFIPCCVNLLSNLWGWLAYLKFILFTTLSIHRKSLLTVF